MKDEAMVKRAMDYVADMSASLRVPMPDWSLTGDGTLTMHDADGSVSSLKRNEWDKESYLPDLYES